MTHRRTLAVTTLAAAAVTLTACSSSTPAASTTAPGSRAPVSGTVTVLAAASLQDSFTTLGKQFQAAHPGTQVKLSFGASSALAQQINQGAPADVFASAAPTNMKQVTDAGGASAPKNFVKTSWRSPSRRATRPRSAASPIWLVRG